MEAPGTREAVSVIRRWAMAVLGDDHPHAYAVELIISELATNAVLHSASGEDGGKVRARLEVDPEGVRISVIDDGARVTPSVPIEVSADNGRGLLIVRELAAGYGEVDLVVGRRTWALVGGDAACA